MYKHELEHEVVNLQDEMRFIREEFPQMVYFGKWKEHWIGDVSEICKVLKAGAELERSSADVIGTHSEVKWNRKWQCY